MGDALQTGHAALLVNFREPRAEALEDVDALYTAYQGRVFRFFLFALHDRDAAASLTQDTFLKAWRTRENFRGDCAAATWLMRIAVNLLRDYTRMRSLQFWRRAEARSIDAAALGDSLPSSGSSAEQELLARESVAAMWVAVEALPQRQRTVFLLRYLEEMTLSEVAEITGLTLPTVKTHLYRALNAVRANIGHGRNK